MTDSGTHEWGAPRRPIPSAPTPDASGDGGPGPSTGTSAPDRPTPPPRALAPPPRQPAPPPRRPVRRKRPQPRLWPWLLGAVILFLALLAGCTAFAVISARQPVREANAFLALLDDGRLDDAYDTLCPELLETVDFDTFQADMARTSEITDYTLVAVSAPAGNVALVSGSIDLGDENRSARIQMERFGDDWLVCDYDPIN